MTWHVVHVTYYIEALWPPVAHVKTALCMHNLHQGISIQKVAAWASTNHSTDRSVGIIEGPRNKQKLQINESK